MANGGYTFTDYLGPRGIYAKGINDSTRALMKTDSACVAKSSLAVVYRKAYAAAIQDAVEKSDLAGYIAARGAAAKLALETAGTG